MVHEILRTGEFILPLRHGETIPSKPILFHWLGTFFATLLPYYDEFALRLPSALAAIATIGVIFALGRACSSTVTALLSVGILLSTYGYTHLAVDGRVDMLFSFFVVTAICLWIAQAITVLSSDRSLREITETTYCLIGILSGLAILAKGPLGIVLPVLVITAIAWRFAGLVEGLKAVFRPGWLFSIAVGLPWYILATLSGKDSFLARQIIFENFTRFFGGAGIPSKPLYYYCLHIWSQMAPWFPLAVLLLSLFLVRGGRLRSLYESSPKREQLLLRACQVWLFSIFVFLSISDGKRRAYLLPAIPAFALLFATHISLWVQSSDARKLVESERLRKIGSVLICAVPLVALIFYAATSFQVIPFLSSCETCEKSLYSLPLAVNRAPKIILFYFIFFSATAAASWYLAFRRRSPRIFLLSVFLFSQVIFLVVVPSLLGIKGITHSFKYFAEHVSNRMAEGESVTMLLKPGDESFDSFFFYYRKPIELQNFKRLPDKDGVYLSRERWLAKTPVQWREKVEEITRGGRLTDTSSEQLVLFRYESGSSLVTYDQEG